MFLSFLSKEVSHIFILVHVSKNLIFDYVVFKNYLDSIRGELKEELKVELKEEMKNELKGQRAQRRNA